MFVAIFSTQLVRQTLTGKGNLRTLLSDQISSWNPYDKGITTRLKDLYDEESLKAWDRVKVLFANIPTEQAINNTWSVIGHTPELTEFLFRGIVLEGEPVSVARVKVLKINIAKRYEFSEEAFQSILKVSGARGTPDLSVLTGFTPDLRARWGLASRVKKHADIAELLTCVSEKVELPILGANSLLAEAIENSKQKKILKLSLTQAIRLSDLEFEIFTFNPNLTRLMYDFQNQYRDNFIEELVELRREYKANIELLKLISVRLSERNWSTLGDAAEKIKFSNTLSLALEDSSINEAEVKKLIANSSSTHWYPISKKGYKNLKELLPFECINRYWTLSPDEIEQRILDGSLVNSELNITDISQLNLSWTAETHQRFIDARIFKFVPLTVKIWKDQVLKSLLLAADSRENDGQTLLQNNLSDVPNSNESLHYLVEVNSIRASKFFRDALKERIQTAYYSFTRPRYSYNYEKPKDGKVPPKNWDQFIATEIGTKNWRIALDNELIDSTNLDQILFVGQSKSPNLLLPEFRAEAIKVFERLSKITMEEAIRLVNWIEVDPDCIEYIAPFLTGSILNSITSLKERHTSFKALKLIYLNCTENVKYRLWKLALEYVTTTLDLTELLLEGIKRGYKIEWIHRWKQVDGGYEDKSKALVLASYKNIHRFNKIRNLFREESVSSSLAWVATQLPSHHSFDIAFTEILSLIGSRHASTLQWLLLQRGRIQTAGCKLDHLYKKHEIAKKSGKMRVISAPVASLKRIQKSILINILNPIGSHPSAFGFVEDKSIVDNANIHIGNAVVVNADVSNCFPSVKWSLVLSALRRDLEAKLSSTSISTLVDICTAEGVLPIGAATSPCLLNRVLFKTDEILSAQSAIRGCQYSRYADDLTFSGDEQAVELLGIAKNTLQKINLELDPAKTNIFRRGRRQMVTGLVVNDKVSVPRRIRKRIRASVHAYESGKDLYWEGNASSSASLSGRLQFLKMVSPEIAEPLVSRFTKVKNSVKVKKAKSSKKSKK